jgi:hypothetical protein
LGMRQGETKRAFRQRMEQDTEQLLRNMLYKIAEKQEVSGDTSPSQPVLTPPAQETAAIPTTPPPATDE